MTTNTQFQWQCQPKAEALLIQIVEKSCNANPLIAALSQELLIKTSTRLFDWVDHVVVGYSSNLKRIRRIGIHLRLYYIFLSCLSASRSTATAHHYEG